MPQKMSLNTFYFILFCINNCNNFKSKDNQMSEKNEAGSTYRKMTDQISPKKDEKKAKTFPNLNPDLPPNPVVHSQFMPLASHKDLVLSQFSS